MKRPKITSFARRAAVFVVAFAVLRAAGLIAAPSVVSPGNFERVILTEDAGQVISNPASLVHDFGPRLPSDETFITRVFVLQNKTGHALTIDLLRPSCGCISAEIDRPRSRMPYALGPGKSVPILVTLEPEASASGPLEKDVSVFVHGQNQPATILTLKGTILTDKPS